MKKITLFGVTLLASFALVACSQSNSTSSDGSSDKTEQTSSSQTETTNVDKNAVSNVLEMMKDVPFSKKALLDYITDPNELGLSESDAKAVIKDANIDFKENAYKMAKQLNDFGMTADKIKESLTSEGDGGGYTESEAKYAIEKLEKELAEEK